MNRAVLLYQLLKYMGPGWLAYRVRHAIEHKLGVLERKLPVTTWDKVEVDPDIANDWQSRCGRFLFTPENREAYAPILRGFDDESIDWHTRVEQIAAGKLSYFSNEPVQVGFPPKWNDNLLQDRPGPPRVHFSKINEFGCGDVKCIWEPSRFSFAYDLVRAYWRTGDERAAEVFWQAAEDWLAHNPPNAGINWKCGQESTFRMMAWCFALFGFADCAATTPERVHKAIKLMLATGRRIEAHLGYALSQKNNHGISEAMGLFTIGLLFPFFSESGRWVELGKKHLESQARTLIYNDGGFVQHSANYHRVMLDDYNDAIRIGRLNDRPLSEELVARVANGGRFLYAIMDRGTGRVPRYGQDDGALILPLSNQPYDDVRPAVQATAAVCGAGDLPLPNGGWDETSVWLAGPSALERETAETRPNDFSAPNAGCHALRSAHGMAFMRAQAYTHRPSQLDELHTDIWWRGQNIALDPGTYSYNAEGAWSPIPLALTAAHNTVVVDGKEQGMRAGRFLFTNWPVGFVGSADPQGDSKHLAVFKMRVNLDGARVVIDRRVVRFGGEMWLVLDHAVGIEPIQSAVLNWNLIDAEHTWDGDASRVALTLDPGPYTLQVGGFGGNASTSLVRADPDSPRGWYAPRYQRLAPCLSLQAYAQAAGDGSAGFFSVFGPGDIKAQHEHDLIAVQHEAGTTVVQFDPTSGDIRRVTMTGSVEDEWRPADQDPWVASYPS